MAHEITERFRRNLRTLCEGYGRARQVSEAAGISREHLSRLMHGKTVPGLDLAVRLAQALEVRIEDMLLEDVEPAEKL